jgi:hypothetical protein
MVVVGAIRFAGGSTTGQDDDKGQHEQQGCGRESRLSENAF